MMANSKTISMPTALASENSQGQFSPTKSGPIMGLLDRDASILDFNARVLDWAKRPEVPLLER